jgi:hypothetical protein
MVETPQEIESTGSINNIALKMIVVAKNSVKKHPCNKYGG